MSEIIPKEPCKRCNGRHTIKVLGGGGDYETWPCPDCREREFNRSMALLGSPVDAEAE